MGDKKYCICCGEEVPYYIVERDQRREYACSYCGFTLEVMKLWEEGEGAELGSPKNHKIFWGNSGVEDKIESRKEEPKIEAEIREKEAEVRAEVKDTEEKEEKVETGLKEVQSDTKVEAEKKRIDDKEEKRSGESIVEDFPQKQDSIKLRLKERPEQKKEVTKDTEEYKSGSTCAIVAEDSEFLRTLLKELIIKKSLAERVVAVSNGLELIAEYTRLFNEKAKINFAIVDINMPEMDGLTAVKTIRTLEDKNGKERVPVVFFSAVKATEDLRKQMSVLEPANYINKGISSSPQILAERVEVLLHFLTYRYTKTGRQESKLKATG